MTSGPVFLIALLLGGGDDEAPAAELRRQSPHIEAAIAQREAQVVEVRREAIKLIDAFLAAGAQGDDRAEAIYKLAELTWEEARYDQLQRMGEYQAKVTACQKDKAACRLVPRRPPAMDLKRPQALYRDLIANHPKFRRLDTALYLYAFSLREEGRLAESIPFFTRLIEEYPRSRWVADAWMALAEHRFYNEQKYRDALAAYEHVLKFPRSSLYDLALFKTAWCHWKLGDTRRAAERFKDVLDLAKQTKGRTGEQQKRAEELQGQALEYLVELFTEDDTKTAQDAFEFLAQVGGREYSRLVLRRLADTVYDQARYERAAEAYRLLITLDKTAGDAPDHQRRVVESLQLLGDGRQAVAEMRKLAIDYGPKSEWAKANADRPNTVAHGRAVAEELIRTLAKTLHADAQRNEQESKTKDADRYGQAADAYRFYLQNFADAPDATELRYYLGDILYFKLGKNEDAGNEYLEVGRSKPIGKYHKDALLQAMSAFEKLRPRAEGAANARKTREITDSDRKFAEAADLYALLFPKDKEIVTVIYKNGEFFYDYGDYDEAVKRFGLIVERYPDDPNAGAAGDRILDSLNRAKDFENIETWARRLKKTKAFAAQAEQTRLDKLIVEALMKSGESHAAAQRFEKSASFYRRVADEYPGHLYAPKALNNAGAALEKAGKPEAAIESYRRLGENYPRAAETPEALFIAARLEEGLAFNDRAVGLYELVADKYPQSQHGAESLRNAGVLRQALGQFDQAARHYAEYGKRYRDRPDAKDVVFQAGVLYADRKDHKAAAAAFADYAQRYAGDARAVEAEVREAEAHMALGADGRAKDALTRALKDAEGARDRKPRAAPGEPGARHFAAAPGEPPGEPGARHFAAQARYLLGELVLRQSERIKIAGKPRQLAKNLDEKAKLLEQARTTFLAAVSSGVPEWATAALARIGAGYESFAKGMRTAAPPKDLTPEEVAVYQEELSKVVVVIEDKAIDAYKSGYKKAIELGIYNKHTQAMRAALGRLAETEFPPETELRTAARPAEPAPGVKLIEDIRRDM